MAWCEMMKSRVNHAWFVPLKWGLEPMGSRPLEFAGKQADQNLARGHLSLLAADVKRCCWFSSSSWSGSGSPACRKFTTLLRSITRYPFCPSRSKHQVLIVHQKSITSSEGYHQTTNNFKDLNLSSISELLFALVPSAEFRVVKTSFQSPNKALQLLYLNLDPLEHLHLVRKWWKLARKS